MNQTSTEEAGFESGFTLVEMLVVMMILAFVATIAMPLFSDNSDGLRLRMAASEIAAALRATRSAAIVRNSVTTFVVDVDRRIFESEARSPRPFPANIEAKLTFAFGIQSGPSAAGFQFFPDGSSTGGDITLALHGQNAKLCIDWLTGEVRQEKRC